MNILKLIYNLILLAYKSLCWLLKSIMRAIVFLLKLVYQAWKQLEKALLSPFALWVLISIVLMGYFLPLMLPETSAWIIERFYTLIPCPKWVKAEPQLTPQQYFQLLHLFRQGFLTLGVGLVGVRTLILSLNKFEQSKKEERNKRFLDAAKLLGEGTSDVRIGGLISLEQLMKEDPNTMGERIVNLLVSFINNRGQYASKTERSSFIVETEAGIKLANENISFRDEEYEEYEAELQKNMDELIAQKKPVPQKSLHPVTLPMKTLNWHSKFLRNVIFLKRLKQS